MGAKGEILVTDTLFIGDEHVRQIADEGYTVDRLDKPEASEEELIERVKGKVGYILGGTESVTRKVIEAGDQLKAISFTGAGYTEFIPGYETARERGVAITAAKGSNSQAVAEFALTLILMATRKVAQLTDPNGLKFETVLGVHETTVGIIGFGDIGSKVASLCHAVGFSVLIAEREGLKRTIPKNARLVDIETLCSEADIVTLHVSKQNGTEVLSKELIDRLKDGASVVNTAFLHAINTGSLVERLKAEEVYAYLDSRLDDAASIPSGRLVQTNIQAGFNTYEALKAVSDQTTKSLLSVLESGEDDFRVV